MKKYREIRKINKLVFTILILISLLIVTQFVAGYDVIGSGTCNCLSCSDCKDALEDTINCNVLVKLTINIVNISSTCINEPETGDNKIFDCDGHIIDGTDEGNKRGIYMQKQDNVTIRNCIISDFDEGILLIEGFNSTLEYNNLFSNQYGIYFDAIGDFNIINDNIVCNNTITDIYFGALKNNSGSNNFCNTTYNWICDYDCESVGQSYLYIEPSNLSIFISNTSEINITASSSNVIGGTFSLLFNNNVIEANNIEVAPFFKDCLGCSFLTIPSNINDSINNTLGTIVFDIALITGYASGTHAVASINFTGKSSGISSIDLYDIVLIDGDFIPITELIITNGTLNILRTPCDCLNCSDCQEIINNENCSIINLKNNIYNYSEDNCILINNLQNKTFDCNSNIITGNNGLQNGVYINNNSYNISITNCVISNFQNGIKIQSSIINDIENNILCNNWEWDIIDWDKISYGRNNTASKIYNFVDIGFIDSTTYQCITSAICISSPSLIAIYIGFMFLLIVLGLLINKQLFYILFGFSLFMFTAKISMICDFGFLWFICLFVSIYFFYKCLNSEN